MICSSWRSSTKDTYNVYIKKWKLFAELHQCDYLNPTEVQVGNFLSVCFDKGLSYSAIKVARAAISSIIISDFTDSRILKRIMKGIFQLRPQLQRTVIWDVKDVLCYFKQRFPAKTMSMMKLTVKFVILLLLVMAQRQQALHLINVKNIDIKYDVIVIRFGDILKTTSPKFHQAEIRIKAYPKDKRLCPVWYMKEYLRRTNKYRCHNSLFLITQKPYTPASKATISNWIRKGLVQAGIDMKIFSPHSTRAAATSKMNKAKVPIATILNTAGWSNAKTFGKYYKKDITTKESSMHSLL